MQFTILLIKGKCKHLYYLSCTALCLTNFETFGEIKVRRSGLGKLRDEATGNLSFQSV